MTKPLPLTKNYGSIGHLPGSRLGEGDHKISEGQAAILLEKARDYKDLIVVQEKLDGANVGVLRQEGELVGLTRKGHRAIDSPLEQFQMFHKWINQNKSAFNFLNEGERVCGEWLAMAHGTRYQLSHEPFVAFDIMRGTQERDTYVEFVRRVGRNLPTAHLLHIGQPITIKRVEKLLGECGHHGALEPAEGAVWRVEREGVVDMLAKYVRADKQDGKYFTEDHRNLTWNWKLN